MGEFCQKIEKTQHFEQFTNPNKTIFYRKNSTAFNFLEKCHLISVRKSATKSLLGIIEETPSNRCSKIDEERGVLKDEDFVNKMKVKDNLEAKRPKKSIMYRADQIGEFLTLNRPIVASNQVSHMEENED